MRPSIRFLVAAAVITAACRDSHAPRELAAVVITTDQANYTLPAGSSISRVEVGIRNNSESTVWIGSCGEGYSSRPGTSPVIAVYGTQLISYETTPPSVGDVALNCSGGSVPYSLIPGTGVRMSILLSGTGRFAFSAPFGAAADGIYDQRTTSGEFTIVAAP